MAPRRKTAATKPAAQPRPPLLEWIMGGLGLLIVLAVLTIILREAVGPHEPAAIAPRVVEVRGAPGAWLAEVEVRNTGDETAAQVEIEGRVGDETASAVVDYVPAGGKERVVLGFEADPRAGLTLRTRGFTEP
jgi:uncharacterized protein (TIGR02588 family)